jgi:hypothetical protein
MKRTINIVPDRVGDYVVTIRRGKVRRYRQPSMASIQRVRCLIRAQLALAKSGS